MDPTWPPNAGREEANAPVFLEARYMIGQRGEDAIAVSQSD